MSELIPLNQDEFEKKVRLADRPVILEFGAPWCGPCRMLEPILVEIAEDYAGRVGFYSVDVDQNPELAMTYGVMGVPTLILFSEGQPVARLTGYRPKHALVKALFADL